MNEYLYILIHISFGYILSFLYKLISFKKRTIIKDILFSLGYIFVYIKFIGTICQANFYLILIMLVTFTLFMIKFSYNKIIRPFYDLMFYIKKLSLYLLLPPIIKYIIHIIKNKFAMIKYYKKYPYKKKSPYELF